ncbi:unnamed protein product [Urochloa humidicola]
MKEVGYLRELRVLHFASLHPFSMEVQINLVESLRNLQKMEYLSLLVPHGPADTATWEAAGFLLSRHLRQLFLLRIRFSRLPSLCINPSRLGKLSHLSLHVDAIDEQELRILGGLPQLRSLRLAVECSSLEVPSCNTTDEQLVCNTAGDGYLLFQKLRHCSLWYEEVRLLPSKDGVPFRRMRWVNASVLLGSEWKGVCSGRGLILPTLMQRVQKLEFPEFSVRKFRDENPGCCDSLCLEYFASLQNIKLNISCCQASAAEVEKAEATFRHAASVHPNHPTLDISRSCQDQMISAAKDKELQQAATSEGD